MAAPEQQQRMQVPSHPLYSVDHTVHSCMQVQISSFICWKSTTAWEIHNWIVPFRLMFIFRCWVLLHLASAHLLQIPKVEETQQVKARNCWHGGGTNYTLHQIRELRERSDAADLEASNKYQLNLKARPLSNSVDIYFIEHLRKPSFHKFISE